MKKIKVFVLFLGLVLLFSPVKSFADGDGSLVLDPNIITNQSTSGTGSNDFPIRSELFSKDLTDKSKALMENQNSLTSAAKKIDFSKTQENKLYTTSYNNVRNTLFKNYSGTTLGSNDESKKNENSELLILAVIAVPLLLLTAVAARKLALRKRKDERTR